MRNKTVRMLGTHGVPANYGGFETAVENVARYLVARGWRVIVYCQVDGTGPITEDVWEGIERVIIPVDLPSWRGTARFDWISIKHACQFDDICLTFGYNTGIYNLRQKLKRIPNIFNMDGIEWSRKRWDITKKAILYINERFAAFYGDVLIADHPVIREYLLTRAPARKIVTIAYGANPIASAPTAPLAELGLEPGGYMTLVARPVPENSILEIVEGFSQRPRGVKLVVVGPYDMTGDPYHARVKAAASDEVLFVGPIFDTAKLEPLRFHGRAYLHGHTVGGTNPSLVEALAAGNAVIANDNPYNRWVAGDAAVYFSDAAGVAAAVDLVLGQPGKAAAMKQAALARHREEFTWDHIASQYEALLNRFVEGDRPGALAR